MSIFTRVMMPKVDSSSFDLSHDVKLSLDMGELIPFCLLDTVPGDKFSINAQAMLRMAPLISPVMHKIRVKMDFFFVPNRMLWDGWDDFISGQNTDDPPPTFNGLHDIVSGDLADYLGYPNGHANNGSVEVNALPIGAYLKIYDEYYRDQNLHPAQFTALVSGTNTSAYSSAKDPPLLGSWGHDYFTSCLPWAQKGDAVTIPLFEQNPDVVIKSGLGSGDTQILRDASDNTPVTSEYVGSDSAGNIASDPVGSFTDKARIDLNRTHEVESDIEASTIETLRNAFTLQRFLELNARGGTRITEWIKSQFNTSTDDLRHSRPYYIGGTSANMVISEVLATAETEGTANIPVGNMAGHGISVQGGKTFSYSCKEHGWIMGILRVIPETAYSQGLPKMLNRPTYLDYLIPAFANLGEQEVINFEIYFGDQTATVEEGLGVFGYIPKYSEYKYKNSEVHGEFKESLNYWTLSREFTNPPALNASFIDCVPGKRIFAVVDAGVDSIYAHVFCKVRAIRKLPKYGVPKL